jgi:hypothetical protein
MRVGGKIIGDAHVDDAGRIRRADQAHQLGRGNLGGAGHGGILDQV